MRAGLLRHRVQLLQPSVGSVNAHNESTIAYPVLATVWAEVEDLSGIELVKAQQIQSEASTRVTIRHREGIKAGWRVKHGDRVLELVGPPIDAEGRSKQLELLCREPVEVIE